MVELSIVVATLESPADAEVSEALEAQSFTDYEIVFRDEYPVTKARNEGIRAATADKIVFLDDDSRPRPDYLSHATRVLDSEAAYAGRTVHPRDDIFAEHFTGHYDWGDSPRYVARFWGCNMGARREVFETVGYWDEQMGWGHEEKELADRVRQKYEIRYNPDMIVDHVYAESIWDYWDKMYHLERGTPFYLRKKGLPNTRILGRTISDLLSPHSYLRRSPEVTLAKSGATVATAVGRFAGLANSGFGTEADGPTRSSSRSSD